MARWRFPSRTPIRWASTRIWRLVRSNAEECFFFFFSVLNRGNLWVNHGKPYGKAIFHRDGGECTVRICQNGILWHSDISTVMCRMQFLESFLRNWSWFNAWALAAFHLLHLIDLGNKNGPKNGQTSQDGHFNEEHDGQTDSNIECWNSNQLSMICLDCWDDHTNNMFSVSVNPYYCCLLLFSNSSRLSTDGVKHGCHVPTMVGKSAE